MNTVKILLTTIFCSFLGTTLVANTNDSDIIYGKGVHAFFDRDYEGTITILSQIPEIKSLDPRPYYFLGLAHLRQEKTDEADQYFKQAAQLEYSGRAARDYNVSESLRRIQGAERQRIEKIRTEEQTNARIRDQQLQEARYGQENATAREATARQLQNQRQEDLALLQSMAGNIGENAFGVKAIDPINAANDNVVVRRVDTNPFGEVTATVSEEPTVFAPTQRRDRTPITPATSARPERTFANVDDGGGAAGEWEDGEWTIESGPVSLSQGTKATAKEFGKALGTLFSRKSAGE